MHDTERVANLLGALSLSVGDLSLNASAKSIGVSVSGAAALVVLAAANALSVTELGRRVGLSQSAAARMVDSLERDAHIERAPGEGRAVSVRLTPHGVAAADAVLAARAEPLLAAIGTLDRFEQESLERVAAKLLTHLYGDIADSELMCRLCDRTACVTGAACPVGAAERAREG